MVLNVLNFRCCGKWWYPSAIPISWLIFKVPFRLASTQLSLCLRYCSTRPASKLWLYSVMQLRRPLISNRGWILRVQIYHNSLFWYSIYVIWFLHLYLSDWCILILFAENSYFIFTDLLSKCFVSCFVQSA